MKCNWSIEEKFDDLSGGIKGSKGQLTPPPLWKENSKIQTSQTA